MLPGLPGGPPYVPLAVQLHDWTERLREVTPSRMAQLDAEGRWFDVSAEQARGAAQKRAGIL